MKIHRVVQMLGATTSTGKLADDMYDLNYKDYYSKEEGKYIPISHMDFQHMVRAFIKLNDKANYFKKVSEDNFIQSVDDLDVIDNLKEKVERLEGIIEEKDEQIDKLHDKYERLTLFNGEQKPKGYEYMFSEIPNTEYGEKLVKSMRAYLNDETYTMRVRGQHLKKELYGQGRAYWGQSIEDSSHLRVYINKKNIKWKDIK